MAQKTGEDSATMLLSELIGGVLFLTLLMPLSLTDGLWLLLLTFVPLFTLEAKDYVVRGPQGGISFKISLPDGAKRLSVRWLNSFYLCIIMKTSL